MEILSPIELDFRLFVPNRTFSPWGPQAFFSRMSPLDLERVNALILLIPTVEHFDTDETRKDEDYPTPSNRIPGNNRDGLSC